jgi:hypothetical protein
MSKVITVLILDNEEETVFVDAGFVIPEGTDSAIFVDRIHELLMDHFEEANLEDEIEENPGDDPTEKGFGSE